MDADRGNDHDYSQVFQEASGWQRHYHSLQVS